MCLFTYVYIYIYTDVSVAILAQALLEPSAARLPAFAETALVAMAEAMDTGA